MKHLAFKNIESRKEFNSKAAKTDLFTVSFKLMTYTVRRQQKRDKFAFE